MGLTGLEIFKQLPKKNCGECGPPTCLAFAMALAAGKASLDTCPYVSDAARDNLASASAPPIRLVKLGVGDKVVELGDETVLFRHDKTFFHPTAVFFDVADNAADLAAKIAQINGLEFDRVGLHYSVDGIFLNNASGDAGTFKAAAEIVASNSKLAIVLASDNPAAIEAALEAVAARKPLIYAATAANYEAMTELAKKAQAPLAVKADGLVALEALVEKVVALGYKDIVLDSGARQTSKTLADLTQIRRLAIKKKFRPFGYPTVAFTTADNAGEEIMQANVFVAKYASMVVLKTTEKHYLLPLLTLRGNIYTDPQKPIQVETRIYEIGEVNPDSPVYVTTNFSLTYYSVEGEVEATKVPSYIIPVNTDGTSVLTAWAAGKFVAESIAESMKNLGIEGKVNHRKVIIPGYVAVLSGKLQELSGWEVVVGPREASGIVAFAKARLA